MLVLLDTCVYLRLAKRIRPFLGLKFGHHDYVLAVLPAVENEVLKNPTLKYHNPWFTEGAFESERIAHAVRLSKQEKIDLSNIKSVFTGHVHTKLSEFMIGGRSPPGAVDCEVLGFAYLRQAIVVTDDLGLHLLAADFKLAIWHGYELLHKLFAAKIVTSDLIRDIYDAMERNQDITATWMNAKHITFKKVFGKRS